MFQKFAQFVSRMVGSVWALIIIFGVIGGTGWYSGFSSDWKENAGLGATVAALTLLVFLQKSQNHSDLATHLKLDELIHAVEGARDEVVSAESHTEEKLMELKNG